MWQATDAYEACIGRWSRPLAEAFLAWVAVAAGHRWLDVGCGTGALTEAILHVTDPSVVVAIDPSAAVLDPRPHFHSCEPWPLADLLSGAGLNEVTVAAIDLPMAFRDLDDFWLPHTMPGAAVAQRYVSTLDDERKTALRERLRVMLPVAADGTIGLIGRAWAVRGTKRPT